MILNYSVARCYHWVGIGRVHGIFLYSFSQFYVNLQHSQNKKCNKTSVGAQCNSTQSLVFKWFYGRKIKDVMAVGSKGLDCLKTTLWGCSLIFQLYKWHKMNERWNIKNMLLKYYYEW